MRACGPESCPTRTDTELTAEALAGPIILRRLMSLEPLEPNRVRTLVDQVLGCTDLGPSAQGRRRTTMRGAAAAETTAPVRSP